MFKKIVGSLLVVCLLAGAVAGIRYLNSGRTRETAPAALTEEIVPNSALLPLAGSGYQLADESEKLLLYVNYDDGNIQVVNKENGFVWRSCPTEEEMARESSNALWKNNLRSPVMFTYTTSASSTDTKYANTLSQETRVSVFQQERGVRVYLEFTESSVTFGYDIALDGNCLKVDIPSYLISDPGEVYKVSSSGKQSLDKKASCLVVDFYLFPSLGATRSDTGNQGCLLVPDGTGALMNFDSDKYAASQYIAHVYGADLALYNGYDTQLDSEMNKPSVNYPIFGVVRDGNTLLGVIDQGETQADIVASKAQVQTGFNTIAARFVYRMKYKVVTNAATGDGYLSYTGFSVQEPRRLLYYFGTGDYVDMAQTYRSYLMEKYSLDRIDPDSSTPLQLYLVGGDTESGMLGSAFLTMTTFAQAQEILTYFKERGIDSIDAVYTGWAKRGESVQYPDRFPAAGALGGDGGLTALSLAAKDMGVRLFLVDDHMTLDSRKGVSISRDAIYNIQNNPLFDGVFSGAAYLNENYENALAHYQGYGISGLEEQTLGWMLLTDYSPSSATSREAMKQAQQEILARIRDDFGVLRLSSCRSYALMNDVTLTYLEGSSYLSILDESVPFYTIALHGLVDYLGGDYMNFYEPRAQLLEAVAQGGLVSFTLSWEGTEKLARADQAAYYSTAYSLWREDVLSIWQELQEYLKATRGQFITGHVRLATGVTLTRYENGVRVLVNNTDAPFQYAGQSIPARSFEVLKGGGQNAQAAGL